MADRIDEDPHGPSPLDADFVTGLHASHLAALEKQARARFREAVSQLQGAGEGERRRAAEARVSRWGEVLREIYAHREDAASYSEIAEKTGVTAADCRRLATILAAAGKPDEALATADLGVEMAKGSQHASAVETGLEELRRELLAKLGRGDEAIESAWDEYVQAPSPVTYERLMQYVPRSDRADWHDRAMEAARESDSPHVIELFLEAAEPDLLAEKLRGASRELLGLGAMPWMDRIVKQLEKPHPDVVARLWLARALELIETRDSTNYDAAVELLERSRQAFKLSQALHVWEDALRGLRAEHGDRSGLMEALRGLAAEEE